MERTKRPNPTNSNEGNFILPSVIGGLIGLGVTVVLLLVLPLLILGLEDPNSFVLPSVCLCALVGNASGGFVSASKSRDNIFMSVLISLATAILPVILISFFVTGDLSLASLIAVLLSTIAGNALAALSVTKFAKSKRRKMKSVMKRR